MIAVCTVCAIVLFICGLMKTMSGYGPGTGLAAIFLSVFWCLYLYTPYVDGIAGML